MKKFIVAVFVTVVFLGCGGGGGGSSSPEPVLAEATTANAFKAYDGMSVATYLPSFFAKIYGDIYHGGTDALLACAVSGTVDVTFIHSSDIDSALKPVSHNFNQCQMSIGSTVVVLNGIIDSVQLKTKNDMIEEAIVGYIQNGFTFKIGKTISMVYNKFPFKRTSDFFKSFAEDGKGSFFTVHYAQESELITNFASYTEETLGDITYAGTFMNLVNFQMDNNPPVTGAFAGPIGEFVNVFLPEEAYDYDGELLIYINKKEFFKADYTTTEVAVENGVMKTTLIGKNDKLVYVWQDDSETVFAQTENTYDTSFTSYTPSFSK